MKTLAELREMSAKELSDTFEHMSESSISSLKSGLKEKYFPTLVDNSLTAPKRAKILDLAESTAAGYRCALLKAGWAKKKIKDIPHEQNHKLILDALLTKPKTYNGLVEETKIPYCILQLEVRDMRIRGELLEFRLKSSGTGGAAYRGRDLFGKLLDKKYFYRRGREKAVVEFIIAGLPLDELLKSKPMRNSITYRLKKCLPPAIFECVYNAYHPQRL